MDGMAGVLDERYINRVYEDMMKEQMDVLRRIHLFQRVQKRI